MKEALQDIRIPVTVGGVTFKNPFYVASGPTTKSVRQLVEIERTGWAAASIKLSIDPAPYINRKPRYGVFEDRQALAFTAEKRLTFAEGLELIREAKKVLTDLKLMANMTYAGDNGVDGWVNMAVEFEKAGADIIELNMCCPNMSYNLELTSGGTQSAAKQTGASMGQNAAVATEIVRAIKKAISIPLFVKLTPEGGKIAQIAKSLYEAGADAVGGTANRLGIPPIDLDNPEKGVYHLQDEISMSCHCGSWLKPLAQRDTYEIRKVCGKEPFVTATGGITNWRDGVEMVLCGGNLLGVCAETLISGYDIVRPMIRGMYEYMQKHGYTSLDDFRSGIVDQVKTANEVTLYAGYAKIKDPNLSAPCKSACPHHVPVQAYVQKIAKGDYRAAFDLITGKNPLQGICALVCPHPCEDACIRGSFDAPVKIRALKRFVLEKARVEGWTPNWSEAAPNGKKIAVIGAGLSGLACACELKKAGYDVTVFEKEAQAGGAIKLIPDYAGHKAVVQEEIEKLQAMGVNFVFGKEITSASEVSGFDGCFVAIGSWEKAGEAVDAMDFLAENKAISGTVAVEGPGFAAIHAARSAVRLGASKVILLWPVQKPKSRGLSELLTLAAEEGVTILERAKPVSLEDGLLAATVDGMEITLPCNQLIAAGNRKASDFAEDTGIPVVRAAKSNHVIGAITVGKNAAAKIDGLLMGDAATLTGVAPVNTVDAEKVRQRSGYVKKDANPLVLNRPAKERKADFEADSRVMTEAEAQAEAARCLNCGCGEGCQLCKTICTDFAPYIADTDTMAICSGECVACGMCYNRCPNGNIEMVNLGQKV